MGLDLILSDVRLYSKVVVYVYIIFDVIAIEDAIDLIFQVVVLSES